MKMEKSLRMKCALILMIVFFVFPAMNAVAEQAKPEKFTFYLTGDLSGPMGPMNCSMIPALSDFCEWFNAEKGGIRGVPFAFVAKDNTGNVSKGVAAYEYFRQQKPKPVVGSFHPAFVGEALKDRLAEDKIVDFFNTASNPILFPVGYLVGCCPSYASGVAAAMNWVKKNWKGGKIKLGLLTWNNSYGKAIFDPELRKWIEQRDWIELVGEEVFSPRDVTVSTQVIRLKNKGANWIVDNTLGNGPVLVRKSLRSMGLLSQDINDTTPGKIHHATNAWGMDDSAVRVGGVELMSGMVGVRPFASFAEKDNPGVKLVTEWLDKKKRGKAIRNASYLIKWAKMWLITEIVGKLVDEKGWEGVTGENFLHEILNTTNFNSLGICDFTYSSDYPMLKRSKIYMVQKNGDLLPCSDYYELPDLRPAKYK
ncbi:MAG: ABC transporter substrate-binding protein [Desulfobacterales bacterium]|nr:ABC transporter substrate-binding protein [Desulfobacterales bacterium]